MTISGLQRSKKPLMSGRDVHEPHRVSTTLELLFDLTFVVAIASSAAQLHHEVSAGHLGTGLLGYATGFLSIWWAWMGFTWFASAYDCDDAGYRVMTMMQMVGVLILAAGVPKAAHGDFTTAVIGYSVMRIGLLVLWLRAAHGDPKRRRTCLRMAIGIFVCQALWVARLWLPAGYFLPVFLVVGVLEAIVPVWAFMAGPTPWHAHHITERYGLFTIIVLGECVLGATSALSALIESRGWTIEVAMVGLGAMSLIFSLWWVYFLVPSAQALHAHRERVLGWAYGHVLVYASLAALGAFLGVVADQLRIGGSIGGGHGPEGAAISPTLVIALVASAVIVYLLTLAWINRRVTQHRGRFAWMLVPCIILMIAVVVAVANGLQLAIAIPLLALGPIYLIVMVEREFVVRPETFRIL